MQFQIITIITTFLAMSQAAPLPMDGELHESAMEPQFSIYKCAESTFINKTSDASPTVADCRQIVYNIRKGGTWQVGAGSEHHQLVQYGTCAFGAQGTKFKIDTAFIGNQDIIDLINLSIDKFQSNGLVGAKGSMGCQSWTNMGVNMTWGLYHN